MKLTFAKAAQAAVFIIFCSEFVAFSFGWIHVPTLPEDAKFFYMVFATLNTILSIQALAYSVQRDDGYIALSSQAIPPQKEPEIPNVPGE